MADGKVFLVGAGPGNPGLLTRRGAACLAAADVVVYDRLIAPELLALAPPEAERIYVGKEGGRHALPQEEINALLVRLGRQARTVVRLKGGDPYLFGRGGEEALALAEAGVDFEVVPGVTSALAALAYAGIPVTHRGLASSVTIVTGHEDPGKGGSTVRWSELATASETLVVLMAMERLEEIVAQLLHHGRSASEPAALVRWGTTPRQEVLVACLGEIAVEARRRQLAPPAVLVVGPVVSLQPRLDWYRRLPLRGARVLVTRSRQQASRLAARLWELGAEPVEQPLIEIQPLSSFAELDTALDRLAEIDWVVFTSANGVAAVFDRLSARGRDARSLARCQVCAIGPATAEALLARGIRADWLPERYVSTAILEGFSRRGVAGQRFLLPRADLASPDLAEGLRALGAEVVDVAAYRTVSPPDSAGRLQALLAERQVDIVTLTSASTARQLVGSLEGRLDLLSGVRLVSIGPMTSRAAAALGLPVDAEAASHTIDGLIKTLITNWSHWRSEAARERA